MFDQETTLDADKALEYRLPTTVTPHRYELRLEPDLKNFTFSGDETVTVVVAQPTIEIVLNALELEIDEAAAEQNGRIVQSARIEMEPARERAHIYFRDTLTPGEWNLSIKFRGILNDKLHGFYRSQYTDSTGKVHTVATTQFEATDARRAFPCWDEPALKAVYKVTLVIDENLTAVSNAGIEQERRLAPARKRSCSKIRSKCPPTCSHLSSVSSKRPTRLTPARRLRVVHVPGKRELTRLGKADRRLLVEIFCRLLPHPVSGRQARPDRDSGFRRRRNGKPGRDHIP